MHDTDYLGPARAGTTWVLAHTTHLHSTDEPYTYIESFADVRTAVHELAERVRPRWTRQRSQITADLASARANVSPHASASRNTRRLSATSRDSSRAERASSSRASRSASVIRAPSAPASTAVAAIRSMWSVVISNRRFLSLRG